MIECPKCHKKLEDGSLFCDECGTKIEEQSIFCPNCGQKIKESDTVCPHCHAILKQEEAVKKHNPSSKKKMTIVLIVILIICGVGGYIMFGPTQFHRNRLVAKAQDKYEEKDYRKSLQCYSKVLNEEEHSEDFYVSFGNSLVKYLDHKEEESNMSMEGDDEFLKDTFGDEKAPYDAIEDAADEYPDNDEIQEIVETLDKKRKSIELTYQAMYMEDPEEAEPVYFEALRLNPENELANRALDYNTVEKDFKKGNWQDLYDFMNGPCDQRNRTGAFVYDQIITDKNYTGKGYIISKQLAYKGELTNGKVEGSGTAFYLDGENLVQLTCDFVSNRVKPGKFTRIALPEKSSDYKVEWKYEGQVNDDLLYDGTFQVEWNNHSTNQKGRGTEEFKEGKHVAYYRTDFKGEEVNVINKVIEADNKQYETGERFWFVTDEALENDVFSLDFGF